MGNDVHNINNAVRYKLSSIKLLSGTVKSVWRRQMTLCASNELATDITDAKWFGDGLLQSGGINKHARRPSSNPSKVHYDTVATFCI